MKPIKTFLLIVFALWIFFPTVYANNNFYPGYYQQGQYQDAIPSKRSYKIMFLSAGHSSAAKNHLLIELGKKHQLEIKSVELRELDKNKSLSQLMAGYDLLLFDSVNANEAEKQFGPLAEQVGQLSPEIKTLAIRWPSGIALRKGINKQQAQTIEAYFSNGGQRNFEHMLAYIKKLVLETRPTVNNNYYLNTYATPVNPATNIPPPIVYPELGIYHPAYEQRIFASPEKYLQWYQSDYLKTEASVSSQIKPPVIAITMHQESLASENLAVHDAIIKQVEQGGAIPLAFYYQTSRSAPNYTKWLSPGGKPLVDVVINTRLIHWAEKRLAEFSKMGVSVLNALTYTGSEQEWRDDNGGIPSHLVPFYLTLSEMAGTSDPLLISAKNKDDGSNRPIQEQLDLVVRKALRVARLKTKANKDKKVAILYYNYPPGEKNASASFLNIPQSVEHILTAMKDKRYEISHISEQQMIDAVAAMQRPFYRQESPSSLLAKDMADTFPLDDYLIWFKQLPKSVQKGITDSWGQPDNHFMVADINGRKHFIIPRLQAGNVLLLPQPARGDKGEREKSIYHSKSLAINHYYLAVYLYLRQKFEVDALVHLGTHGSHEWLPGKERGLWAYDPGNLTADDIPVIYPYIVDDVGEALQAKRRGRAVMLSHMTPPFAPSGLYRELSEVHELMHQYGEVDPGLVKKRTRKQLIAKLETMNILADMGWEIDRVKSQFEGFMDELHDYMHDLATANQPLGLHTWGQVSENRLLVTTIMQILGDEFNQAISAYQGGESDDINDGEHNKHEHTQQSSLALMKDQSQFENLPGFSLLHHVLIGKQAIPENVPENLRQLLNRGIELLDNIRGNQEMSGLLTALNGGFIAPSTGGDPIRNQDSLPTGRNLYGFDPSRVPTKAAWESGKQLVEGMIKDYVEKHGKYPDKMAFSLWSIETMRHYGVLESQALYAMGLRPVWTESGRLRGTEIIPYAELKRPRVDVVLSATGLYRDAFPNVMKLMAEGIDKIAQLKEENNFVYRHTQRLRQDLIKQGKTTTEADYLSTIRIFSGASGRYGTGLNAAVLASDTWETDRRLANMYMDRMGYGFGRDESRWGEKIDGVSLYAKNLSGTNMALFSRSSNLYGLLTSDDPFQYLGGISLAVRNLDGKDPEMFISNLRNPNQEKIQTLNQFLSQELRSRYFHPRWIKEMQKEGYSGTLSMVDTLNNFWGWQVVDPQNIRDAQWQEFFEIYVEDKYQLDMQAWFEKNNPEALAQMTERMLEAVRKDYWKADEQVVKKLVSVYEQLREHYDIQTINQKFTEFVSQKVQGYGLIMDAAQTQPKAQVNSVNPQQKMTEKVQGQQLEKVESTQEHEPQWLIKILLALVVIIVISGAVWQQWREEILAKIQTYQLLGGRA